MLSGLAACAAKRVSSMCPASPQSRPRLGVGPRPWRRRHGSCAGSPGPVRGFCWGSRTALGPCVRFVVSVLVWGGAALTVTVSRRAAALAALAGCWAAIPHCWYAARGIDAGKMRAASIASIVHPVRDTQIHMRVPTRTIAPPFSHPAADSGARGRACRAHRPLPRRGGAAPAAPSAKSPPRFMPPIGEPTIIQQWG